MILPSLGSYRLYHGRLVVERRARLDGGSWNRRSEALPSRCAGAPAVRSPSRPHNKQSLRFAG